MTLNNDVKSINCTACGAGLDVLGGGRVTTHICPYCGTELDATDDYRALKRFNDKPRPKTPFPIGTIGEIKGVQYTVIGLLEHVEYWNGRSWAWLDHQLYSPTHGYAWITLEEGHCTFSRRFRRPITWMSPDWVERAETRPVVYAGGGRYNYYETTESEINYAEGEFSWQPRKHDKTLTVSAMSDTQMLSFSQTGSEREVTLTTYLSADDIAQGFGPGLKLKPGRVHPLQPFKQGPNSKFLQSASAIYAVICVLVLFVLSTQTGREVYADYAISRAELPYQAPLQNLKAGELVELTLSGNGVNTWSGFELEITSPEDEVLFTAGRAVERYSGRDADGNWSEGRNSAQLSFRAPVSGDYVLYLDLDSEEVWRASGASKPRGWTELGLTVRSGIMHVGWLMLAALGFGGVAAWPWLRANRHHKARWRRSDWTDED
ncbi:DUF4178 domain-containing protein [Epibacterium sp. SM1969]|uniref:DUF4178 domain-containing protein n=1 Tax=Tritonibacter aquimaris TaxID=2663379 RepID=A0A844B3X9_9RHOB|nr:DUF4178 domain-containing protein [Tritonibacter aquimaris]MQY44086.1 DUF4178 domain-containing protein [Tritonibacter aquimaris]